MFSRCLVEEILKNIIFVQAVKKDDQKNKELKGVRDDESGCTGGTKEG